MKHVSWLSGLCLILCCATSLAFAQGNLYVGNVHLMPSLGYQAEYSTNIFLSHTDETEDIIHTVSPGIHMEYDKGQDRFLRGGYEVDFVRYSEESDNNYEEHRADLEARYSTPAGWYIGLEDSFVDTEDPYSTGNNYQLGTPQVKRWTNTWRTPLGYRFAERLESHFVYVNYLKKYDAFRDQWLDRHDHIYEGRVMYRFWPKTSLFVLYRLQDINYPNQKDASDNELGIDSGSSQDNLYHQPFLGLYFSPAAKIKGEFKVGLGKKDYKNNKNWFGNSYNDDWDLNTEAEIDYLFSEKTRFDLYLLRAQYESVEPESTSFTQTRIRLGAEQEMSPRYNLRCKAGYILWDFDTVSNKASRNDDTFSVGAGMFYEPYDWMETGIEYNYEGRFTSNSAYRDHEYVDNRIKWIITAHY